MNALQEFLLKNKPLVYEVVKIFHPEMTDTYISPYSGKTVNVIDKIQLYTKYDWVCIRGNGVDMGIKFPVNFMGMGWGINDFESELTKNKIRVWRFSLDKKFTRDDKEDELKNKAHNFLIKNGCPLPSATELFRFYYRD